MPVILVSLIVGVLVAFYFYVTQKYKYWQKRGIPCADGIYPIVGHMWMLSSKTIGEFCSKIYNNNKKHSMVGIYNLMSPTLMVLEPELVKTVLQTNFASFYDNGLKVDPKLDPLLALNPFFSYGEKWSTARKRFSYAFSNMRLKILLESVKPVCVMLENFLDSKLDKSGKAEIELKNLFSRFSAQTVAAAGFGVDGFCFDDEKKNKSFRNIGKAIIGPSIRNKIVFTIALTLPSLNRLFKVSFLTKQIDEFFRTLVTELIEQRRTDKTSRNDFLHLMVELERIEGNKFDIEQIASHTLSFVVDGYETTSTSLSFAVFQLATHSEVQDKLRNEILSVFKKYNDVITYEALKEMTYMDQVLNESQRLVPIAGFMLKTCMEEFELKGSDGLTCRVQPGTTVMIPTQGLHQDSRYWENSSVFDPDRFSPDRKHNVQKFTFLPFSEGPRMCVGMRMALLQMKACLAALLRKYSLEISPKMQLPLKMVVGTMLPTAKDGLWVNIRKI
jgi:cytochrome P450